MTIPLSERDKVIIREKVRAGRFRNADEAFHAAVTLLQRQALAMESLHAELQTGTSINSSDATASY